MRALGLLAAASLALFLGAGGATSQPRPASTVGRWEVLPYRSPVRAIHASLLHTGEVLIGAGSGNNQAFFEGRSFKTVVWDVTRGSFTAVPTPWDLFCSGHAALADGRILVAGGTTSYTLDGPYGKYAGSRQAYVYDPARRRYQRTASLSIARWYPTLTRLGDGGVLATAGWDDRGEVVRHSELYDPGSGAWRPLEPEEVFWPTYPGLVLLEDGRLFYSGAQVFGGLDPIPPGVWEYRTNAFTPVSGLRDLAHRDHAFSVLLPPAQEQRVAVFGGGTQIDGDRAINLVDVIDLKASEPGYRPAAPLAQPRMYASAVILPDRTLLVTGGGRTKRRLAVLDAQIYDPRADSWTTVAAPSVPRLYHSEALLLPDGRVATLGSNPLTGFELRIEVYSPPYLFKGKRPSVSAPSRLRYGGTYRLRTEQAGSIRSVSLVSPASVTHSLDPNQRLVDVPFSAAAGRLDVTIPASRNMAPPGWYMLFVVDRRGVPSLASWVHVS